MSPYHSVSTNTVLSKATIPLAPETEDLVLNTLVPSHLTFAVNPRHVYAPQTGYAWYIEMDHNMQNERMFSLIPQKSDNQYVCHYQVESRRPRFVGKFVFSDAWITTNHHMMDFDGIEVHMSQRFYNPERTHDKLFFNGNPVRQIEVVATDRLIGDREIFDVLERVLPWGSEIPKLLQRQS